MPIVTYGRVLAAQIALSTSVAAGLSTVLAGNAWRGTILCAALIVSVAVVAGIARVLRVRFGEVEPPPPGRPVIGLTPRIAAAIGLVVAFAAAALLAIHHFINPTSGPSRAMWYGLTLAGIVVLVDWWYVGGLKRSSKF